MERQLTHISLFAGIGGIDLAAEWAGFRTILFVEIDKSCQKVLNKRWPKAPIIGDIKDATKEKIMAITENQGIIRRQRESRDDDVKGGSRRDNDRGSRSYDGSERNGNNREGTVRPVTLITGGFPCQPVSHAGQRRGKADDRWLWPEMLRVISEVRPAWVVAENVTGLLTMGFYDCLSNLESEGYETIPFVIPACGVNAPHRRDRIFIVAYTEQPRTGSGCGEAGDQGGGASQEGGEGIRQGDGKTGTGRLGPASDDVADTEEQRLPLGISNARGFEEGVARPQQGNWWSVEPDVGRVAYGIPSRVDRLKALGNAIVPQQIYPILKAIADIELGGCEE